MNYLHTINHYVLYSSRIKVFVLIYACFSVLELSKTIYKLYYHEMKPKYRSDISLLYSDTNSLAN